MQIILSRKGFDSQYGGQPSPILPDGTLLSLPIPLKGENLLYSDIFYKNKSYLNIIRELNPKSKIEDNYTCHLDPDLRENIIKRDYNWHPLFGQTSSAQGHLLKNEIAEDDLFLFFGTFRETEYDGNILRYKKGTSEIHIIYGYLQIGKIHNNFESFKSLFAHHPHAQYKYSKDKINCIYEARRELSFLNKMSGANILNFHKKLVLTKDGFSKSKWSLPNSFRDVSISYHSKNSFTTDYFQSVAKGQEFVIKSNLGVLDWAKDIIINGTN